MADMVHFSRGTEIASSIGYGSWARKAHAGPWSRVRQWSTFPGGAISVTQGQKLGTKSSCRTMVTCQLVVKLLVDSFILPVKNFTVKFGEAAKSTG